MASQDAILLKVFSGGAFCCSPNRYGTSTGRGEMCTSIPDFDRDYMSYFELRDCLKEFGLKKGDRLYYLKPGYSPPNGLVLIFYDTQCNQLLADHVGLSSCNLYIVPDPENVDIAKLVPRNNPTQSRVRSLVDTLNPMEIGGGEDDIAISEYMAHLSEDDGKSVEDDTYENTDFDEIDDTSDIDLIPEHEVENKVVDSGGYIFDGDVGDDDLYSLRMRESTIQSKGKDDGMNRDEGKGKVSGTTIGKKKKVAAESSIKNNPGGVIFV